jgi:hypothetical protein
MALLGHPNSCTLEVSRSAQQQPNGFFDERSACLRTPKIANSVTTNAMKIQAAIVKA